MKTYIQPQTQAITLTVEQIIATSMQSNSNVENTQSSAWTREKGGKQGSSSTLWSDMQ